jgi:predicted Rossmann fold flavoprotein
MKCEGGGMERYDVIVAGGGAAGMMAAGQAAARGKRVLLLEKNARLGEKLRISGGGRCNITNAEEDEKALLAKYGAGEQFLYSPFSQFGVKDTFAFFEGRGLLLTVQAKKRAFPQTEKAADVVRALEAYLKEGGVTVRVKSPVTQIRERGGKIQSVFAGKNEYQADAYIFAAGGVSHPETGSTGDGFRWLRELGHTVVDPTPTIVPLKVREKWVRQLSGMTAPDAKITFRSTDGKKLARKGSVLFTHFGISGPTVLNAAGAVADLLHEGDVVTTIDLYPSLDLGILDKRIATVFDGAKNKMLKNVFKEVAPAGMTDTLLALVPVIKPETKVHSITREERRQLAELLKGLTLTITGLMGFERAVVADGGVPPEEVDMKTMRSKKVSNLYLVGDLLHITRPSGGYSLQLCWTTGYVAGTNI